MSVVGFLSTILIIGLVIYAVIKILLSLARTGELLDKKFPSIAQEQTL